jgi:archaellum component FlaF (FlaF/FlaG flagellin family)
MPNTPQGTTAILQAEYPAWWSNATTVEVTTVTNGVVVTAPDNIEIFPHGVSIGDVPDNPTGDWKASLLPWGQIVNLYKAS